MKKLLSLLFILCIHSAYCQTTLPSYRNKVQFTVNRLGLPDATGYLYQGGYGRSFWKTRGSATIEAGYLKSPNPRTLTGTTITFDARPTKRITFDATAAYDFLKAERHALRMGIGPSVWYYEDEIMGAASYTTLIDGTITNVKVSWQPSQGWAVGGHIQAEYEYVLTRHTTFGAKLGVAPMTGHDGLTAIAGLVVGHRF